MKTVACITIFLSLLIATTAPVVLAQGRPGNQTIDVIGTGRIRGGNISGARDQAISDCLVTAISLATKDLLQQQVFIQSFQDINRLLFLGADNFVQGYKVLTEDTTGRVYRVMVQVTVSVDKIRELLIQNEILSRNAGPLKVLLLVAEQDLENILYKYWWGDAFAETASEAPLAAALADQGFVVVDHRSLWSVSDDFDTLLEIPLGLELGSPQADTPVERKDEPLDHDPSWPGADSSDTVEEFPLAPEMSDIRAGTPTDREDIPHVHSLPWPDTGDPGTVTDAPLQTERDDTRAGLSIEWKDVPLGHSLPMPDTGNFDTFTEIPIGPEMNNDQAAAFGARFEADVVVVGTATVKKASNVLGDELKSFEGALSVRAIRTDTGAVLAEIDHKFITADADDLAGSHRALIEAGTQAGELLSWKIQTAWQQTLKKGPTAATIMVEGNFQLPHLVAFRRILSGMQGVSDLQTTEMSPKKTTLSLDYDGATKELAEALLLKSFEGFGVHITEATPETIRLSLVSN